MTIIAKFSNGYTDEYKGTRPVTAAWAVIRKSDGKVLNSGHSLDAEKARKTAEGTLARFGTDVLGAEHPLRAERYTKAIGMGYHERRRARAHNAERKALISQGVTIEVVAL